MQLDSIQKRQCLVDRLRKVLADSSASKYYQIKLEPFYEQFCTPELWASIVKDLSLTGEISNRILLVKIQGAPGEVFIRCTRR